MSITRRQQVAEIEGKAVYVITDVAFIPLATRTEAGHAIKQAIEKLDRQHAAQDDNDVDSSENEQKPHGVEESQSRSHDRWSEQADGSSVDDHPSAQSVKTGTSVAEDVLGRRGAYGRFAERWFSKQGWGVERRRTQGMSPAQVPKDEQDPPTAKSKEPVAKDVHGKETLKLSEGNPAKSDRDHLATLTLLPKLLQSTRMLLTSRSLFFSYDVDITRRVGSSVSVDAHSSLPNAVDPLVSGPKFCSRFHKLHII